MELQPILEDQNIILIPLQEEDFEALYAVASDPEVWEQHPNKNRFQKDVFKNFFEGAIQSGGAYKICLKSTGAVLGSTRFYDYDAAESQVFIGYTFYGKKYWGQGYNQAVKKLMVDHALQFVNKILFHVGADNHRSNQAMKKINAELVKEEIVAYYGEGYRLNYLYKISR